MIGIEVPRDDLDEQRPREQWKRDAHIVGMEASAVHERKLHPVVHNQTPSRSLAFGNLLGEVDRRWQRDGRLGALRCEPLANAICLLRDHNLREPGRARVSLLQWDLYDDVRHCASPNLPLPTRRTRRVNLRGSNELQDDGAEGGGEVERRSGGRNGNADMGSGQESEAESGPALDGGGTAERDAEVARAVMDNPGAGLRVRRENRLLSLKMPRNVRHRGCDWSRVRPGSKAGDRIPTELGPAHCQCRRRSFAEGGDTL